VGRLKTEFSNKVKKALATDAKMDFSSNWEMQPLEELVLHFNAWLHGDEVGPAVYRI